MDIEIKCSCGAEFNFTEEPVNGRLASAVACPTCRQDTTREANEFIARSLTGATSPAPARSRFGTRGGAAAHPKSADDGDDDSSESSTQAVRFVLGGLAAVAVAALCAYGWYELAIYTGFYFGFLAWAIGGVVGSVCRWIVPYGQTGIAVVAGASSCLAIAAGHALVVHAEIRQILPRSAERAYALNEAYARAGARLTDESSIREFLAEHAVKYELHDKVLTQPTAFGPTHPRNLAFMRDALFRITILNNLPSEHQRFVAKRPNPEDIPADQVKSFRDTEQPALAQFLAGKPSPAEWRATLQSAVTRQITLEHLLAGGLTPHSVAWMVFGFLLGYKLVSSK